MYLKFKMFCCTKKKKKKERKKERKKKKNMAHYSIILKNMNYLIKE